MNRGSVEHEGAPLLGALAKVQSRLDAITNDWIRKTRIAGKQVYICTDRSLCGMDESEWARLLSETKKIAYSFEDETFVPVMELQEIPTKFIQEEVVEDQTLIDDLFETVVEVARKYLDAIGQMYSVFYIRKPFTFVSQHEWDRIGIRVRCIARLAAM